MVALFVSAAVVGVMLIIVMQKGSLSAHRARQMFPPTICPPPTSVVRVQIDDGSFGRDTSDTHRDLCRNDKMNDRCCILDTECDMISS